MEGFDYEGSSYGLQNGVVLLNVLPGTYKPQFNVSIASSSSRWGTGSYAAITNNPGPFTPNIFGFVVPFSTTVSEVYLGASISITGGTSAYIGFYDVSTGIVQFAVVINSYGVVSPQIGNISQPVINSTLSSPFSYGWNHVEIHGLTGSSGAITVKINGVAIYSGTGLNILPLVDGYGNTIGSNAGNISGVVFGNLNSQSGTVYVDDVYACSTSGSINNSFLGDVRVEHSVVSGTGSHAAFTPNATGTIWDYFNTYSNAVLNPQYAVYNSENNKQVTPVNINTQVTALSPQSAGQFYVEFDYNAAAATSTQIAVGLIPTTFSTASNTVMVSSTNSFNFITSSNSAYMASSPPGSYVNIGSATAALIIAFAINMNTRKVWVNLNNAGWLGAGGTAGDPVAGTNGYDISFMTAPLILAMCATNSTPNSASVVTINAGSGTTYSAPSGYGQWTLPSANWANVNKNSPDDETFNYSGSTGNIDTFAQNSSYSADTIYAVQVVNYAREDDGNGHNLAAYVSSSGIEAQSSDTALTTGYQYIKQVYEIDPNTSTPWTYGAVNSLLIGYKET